METYQRRFTYSYCGCIQVHVGEDDKKHIFDVHESLITARSLFFKKALSGDWKEAKDRVVMLPEDDSVTFRRYVYLLYTGSFIVIPDPLPENYRGTDERQNLLRLYVLAEKLQDSETENAVLEAMLLSRQLRGDGLLYLPSYNDITLLYSGTTTGSPMRKMIVEMWSNSEASNWLTKETQEWPSDFLYELSVKLLDRRDVPSTDPTATEDISAYVKAISSPGP
jgi:hypothetical protein